MGRFSGHTAVVTGATSGIGRAIACLLGEEGARVYIVGRDPERGALVAAEVDALGGEGIFHRADVAVDSEVRDLAIAASADGPIDLWFSNAGVEGPIGPMSSWDDDALREVLDVNVKGVLSGLRYASEHMVAGGVVVNTASFVGTVLPVPIAVPYAATKAAVVAIGSSAAVLLADSGIDVYTLCPWVIDTPMVTRLAGDVPSDREGFAAGFAPSGLLTPAADVARAALDLLASPGAARSGDAFLVDAGPTVSRLNA